MNWYKKSSKINLIDRDTLRQIDSMEPIILSAISEVKKHRKTIFVGDILINHPYTKESLNVEIYVYYKKDNQAGYSEDNIESLESLKLSGRIYLNAVYLNDKNLKYTIYHELSHIIDVKFLKGISDNKEYDFKSDEFDANSAGNLTFLDEYLNKIQDSNKRNKIIDNLLLNLKSGEVPQIGQLPQLKELYLGDKVLYRKFLDRIYRYLINLKNH